jgi:calmodulin
MDAQKLQRLIFRLDKSGNGLLSKDAFVHWHMNDKHQNRKEDFKETARQLFRIFDISGDGDVSTSEFTSTLAALKTDLTTDEILALVRDFDVDGDGKISLEEFEKVIEMSCG